MSPTRIAAASIIAPAPVRRGQLHVATVPLLFTGRVGTIPKELTDLLKFMRHNA